MRRIQITGEPQRTISSTPVAAMPVGSACHRARWSGCSVRASSPWLMALRVVSLPATTSRMKKDATSVSRERLAVDVGVDQGGGDVVGRVLPAVVGQVGHEQVELLRRVP